ncbi:MAG: Gfo/Idh/MocA family oxidoreductase [Lentisphaeria bacterium]|nr:Gfo/Idh/MocA family oxidoreductase [Lentisphaeria bacterium]
MDGKKSINIGLIGQQFMGRAHSNAWTQARHFCSPPLNPVLHTICARNMETLIPFSELWGWQNTCNDYEAMCRSPEIDLVDVTAQNHMHLAMSKAALAAGKAVACEKPLAGKFEDAREMAALARKSDAPTFVWYNYRSCPAVAYARQLVREDAIGTIRHVRGFYLQDWADESVPLLWRFDGDISGSGSHGDLCAHTIDMVRFVTGEEITEINGALFETFIKERAQVTKVSGGGIAANVSGSGDAEMVPVTVDDAVLFLSRLEGGAVCSFEATRMATGRQNYNGLEINGTKGSVRFNFERNNELEYYDATGPRGRQGWRTIMCTHEPDHPYSQFWWPDSHGTGYEHAFINMAADILRVLAGEEPISPMPDFEDAFKTQCVLEAVTQCFNEQRTIKLSEVT